MSELREQEELLPMIEEDLLTVNQASLWASDYTKRDINPTNIMYLIQYGRLKKYTSQQNGTKNTTLISKAELIDYYRSYAGHRQLNWKKKLGQDLNWHLSFENIKERETTKHIHRLHPYKGKFIPQLVEYFLNPHTDNFKKHTYFHSGDIILDPFCGSGTTLIQANELGIHAIGIDISQFNSFITNTKLQSYDLNHLTTEIQRITHSLQIFSASLGNIEFQVELQDNLSRYNLEHFPSPEFKLRLTRREIDETAYAQPKVKEFQLIYTQLVNKYRLQLLQKVHKNFLDRWLLLPIRQEVDFVRQEINKIEDEAIHSILSLVLSRTVRSCRATSHADLATLKEPITEPYYCAKHGKICKPLFSILSWWQRYTQDTIYRLREFSHLRTATHQLCLTGDGRDIDIVAGVRTLNPQFYQLLKQQQLAGIFSSPPYIGLIDYHEQHAYAYELLGFERRDQLEIGPKFRGQSKMAREAYAEAIATVLNNCRHLLKADFNIFIVANDKYNLYPSIAAKANMVIVNRYKRPVLNRTEKDKGAYAETIFHLRDNASIT